MWCHRYGQNDFLGITGTACVPYLSITGTTWVPYGCDSSSPQGTHVVPS